MKLKEELKSRELDDCSFKPKIKTYKKESESPEVKIEKKRMSTIESTTDRCKFLYELAKKTTKNEQPPAEEYPFNPDIKRLNVKASPLEVSKVAVDKEIERMKKANQERKRIESAFTRFDDNSSMKFHLQRSKYKGDFQQFQNTQGRLRNSYSMKKLDKDKFTEGSKPNAKLNMAESNNLDNDIKVDLNNPAMHKRRKSQIEAKGVVIDVKFKNSKKRLVIKEGTDIGQIVENLAQENSNLNT
jgi:hypothetical protein